MFEGREMDGWVRAEAEKLRQPHRQLLETFESVVSRILLGRSRTGAGGNQSTPIEEESEEVMRGENLLSRGVGGGSQ